MTSHDMTPKGAVRNGRLSQRQLSFLFVYVSLVCFDGEF